MKTYKYIALSRPFEASAYGDVLPRNLRQPTGPLIALYSPPPLLNQDTTPSIFPNSHIFLANYMVRTYNTKDRPSISPGAPTHSDFNVKVYVDFEPTGEDIKGTPELLRRSFDQRKEEGSRPGYGTGARGLLCKT